MPTQDAKSAKDVETFAVNDVVDWLPEETEKTGMQRTYGEGPFIVMAAKDADELFQKQTGHPQQVTIAKGNRRIGEFSGRWFKKVA